MRAVKEPNNILTHTATFKQYGGAFNVYITERQANELIGALNPDKDIDENNNVIYWYFHR